MVESSAPGTRHRGRLDDGGRRQPAPENITRRQTWAAPRGAPDWHVDPNLRTPPARILGCSRRCEPRCLGAVAVAGEEEVLDEEGYQDLEGEAAAAPGLRGGRAADEQPGDERQPDPLHLGAVHLGEVRCEHDRHAAEDEPADDAMPGSRGFATALTRLLNQRSPVSATPAKASGLRLRRGLRGLPHIQYCGGRFDVSNARPRRRRGSRGHR